ncbi:hypothetical protein NQZ68_016990 [Dissostichus eleginoides]|nr:hypothetical protein NQZ68_016990 [Dissostichus eleginoides]
MAGRGGLGNGGPLSPVSATSMMPFKNSEPTRPFGDSTDGQPASAGTEVGRVIGVGRVARPAHRDSSRTSRWPLLRAKGVVLVSPVADSPFLCVVLCSP